MKYIFSYLFVFFILGMSNGQILTVLDAETNQAVEMVILYGKVSKQILHTDQNGKADISIFKDDQAIEISLIGYKTMITRYSSLASMEFVLRLQPAGITIDGLVVSASRWSQQTSRVPAAISTITSGDISLQNPQTAADVLGLTGKVFVQKSQQGGGSPMIRGFATNRLIYVVDGVRMNTAIFRSGNIQNVINLDPFVTEKTEVIFGPGSVLYGSDAIGGTMGFYTLSPKLSEDGKPLVRGGAAARYSTANQEKTGHFHVNVGWQKWAMVSSVSSWDFGHLRQGSKGPSDYIKPVYVSRQDNTDRIITQQDPLLQIPTGYSQMNILQKVRYAPNQNWDFTYAFHWSETSDYGRYDRHNRYRNGMLRYAEWDYGPQSWNMHLLSMEHDRSNILYDKASIRVARQKFGESRMDRNLNSSSRNIQAEDVLAISLNTDFIKSTGSKNDIFYGFEYVINQVESSGKINNILTGEEKKGPSRYPGASWESLGFYLQDAFRISEKWTLQSGIRYNRIHIEADFANNLAFYPLPFAGTGISHDAVTGSVGTVFRPTESLIFKANAGTAFRSPNVDDMGKFFDSEPGTITVPNPELKPEYAYNADLGLTKIWGDAVKIDLSVYYTILRNALVRRNFNFNGQDSLIFDGEMSRVQAIQNAAIANVYGVEGGIEIKLPAGFRFSSDINFQIGEEELDNGSVSPSRHAAPLFGVSRLIYRKGPLQMQLNVMYQGTRTHEQLAAEERGKTEIYAKDKEGNTYSPSWYTLNWKAMYQVSKQFSISTGLENMTDQRYRSYSSGMSGAGRNFVLSVNVTW